MGAWSPYVGGDHPTSQAQIGGARVGAAVGYLAAATTPTWREVDGRLVLLQGVGFTSGSLLGAGIPLSTGIEGPVRGMALPMILGGVAGHLGGSLAAPAYQLGAHDALLLPLLQGWAVYQSVGWGICGANVGASAQATGFALTSLGLGTAAAWGVPAVIELTPAQTTLAFSSSLWGTWYGAWGSFLVGAPASERLPPTLAAGDVALILGALPEAFGWRPGWGQVAALNGGAALGAGLGALVGVLTSPDARTIGAASLVGTTAGVVGGAFAARALGGEAQAAAPARSRRLPFSVGFAATPWVDEAGGLGAHVQLELVERRAP